MVFEFFFHSLNSVSVMVKEEKSEDHDPIAVEIFKSGPQRGTDPWTDAAA